MAKNSSADKLRTRLVEAALGTMKNAYAPYSGFKVGAALLTSSGAIFTGCNVENASYGLTNCAERTAIFSAAAFLGPKMKIRALAIVNSRSIPFSPCGACRQVIYEFGPKATVFFPGTDGWQAMPIEELLPEGFRLK